MQYRIISIGALSVHELWERQGAVRTPHATTTLIRTDDGRNILVDPGLPPGVIAARLAERAGLEPSEITDVFLTNFRPAHRWGLPAFEGATWHLFEREREAVGQHLLAKFQQYRDEGQDEEVLDSVRKEIATLQRCKNAPDKLAERVDLFPLPGYTPGTCGLLLLETNATVLIAGDAVPTVEHLERGRVLKGSFDIELAQESLLEAIEIADVIVPGHDNLVLNRGKKLKPPQPGGV